MKRDTEKNIFQSMIVERSKRKAVQIAACLINNNTKYAGFIINISSRGVGLYLNTKFSESTIECEKGSILKLELESPSGESISMQCKVMWLRIKKRPENSLTTSLGLEVFNPSPSFMKLFESLF